MNPPVTLCIATRNRKTDLVVALASAQAQSYRPLEILVLDDASSDDAETEIRERFPDVRYLRWAERRGQCVLRNAGVREARGSYVFGIDDDAYFTDARSLEPVVDRFERDPSMAAAALAFVEPRCPPTSKPLAENIAGAVRSFTGCAHAVRKEAFLALGGYREYFDGWGEERDLCLRLQGTGSSVVYTPSPPIVHRASPIRDKGHMNLHGVRNTLLFDSLNIPQPYMLPRLVLDAVRLLFYRLRFATVPVRMGFVLQGLRACARYRHDRDPVSGRTYREYRALPGHGPLPCKGEAPPPIGG